MSLELIDRIIKNWKNPEYKGLVELSSYIKYEEPSDDKYINAKLLRDIEDVRYLIPSIKKLNDYGNTMEDLIEFYKDLNFIEGGFNKKVTHYKLHYRPDENMLNDIMSYLRDDMEYITEISVTHTWFYTINLINKTNARIVTFSNMVYEYTWYGKIFLDNKYPGKVLSINGHTKYSIPAFKLGKEPNVIFDAIFINMNKMEFIYEDIINLRELSNDKTIIILLNINPVRGWGVGSYIAMNKLILEGVLSIVKYHRYTHNSFAVLKYCFDGDNKKISLEQYREIEQDIPLYEFGEYIKQNEDVELEIVKLYIKKFKENDIIVDQYLWDIIKEKFPNEDF